MAEISAIDARRILRALRKGATPDGFARELFVGHAQWFACAVEEMGAVAEDEDFGVRFLRARYGGGKSHFLECLEQTAQENRWVTATVVLKPDEIELDRFSTIAQAIGRHLRCPDGGVGLEALLQQSLGTVARNCGYRPGGAMRPMVVFEQSQARIEALCSRWNVGGVFRLALRHALRALVDGDLMLLAETARWLGGSAESLTIDPARLTESGSTRAKSIVLKPLSAASAEELLRLLALMAQWSEARGLFLALDEIEMIGRQRPLRRQNSLQTLRALIDQTDRHQQPPATVLFLAATPEMFEDSAMFPSYKALQDRIDDFPSLEGNQSINYRAWDPLESTCRHASLSIL